MQKRIRIIAELKEVKLKADDIKMIVDDHVDVPHLDLHVAAPGLPEGVDPADVGAVRARGGQEHGAVPHAQRVPAPALPPERGVEQPPRLGARPPPRVRPRPQRVLRRQEGRDGAPLAGGRLTLVRGRGAPPGSLLRLLPTFVLHLLHLLGRGLCVYLSN